MTNREAYEDAAGMGLDNMFFTYNYIEPDAEYACEDDKASEEGRN